MEIELADGRRISVPLSFYPSLANASPVERREWEYWPFGTALEWPRLDLQISVESIVAGRREHLPPPGFRARLAAAAAHEGVQLAESRERRYRKAG